MQGIVLAIIAVAVISAIAWHAYSSEQARQRGFEFGNELARIQDEVREHQNNLTSKVIQWKEGDLTTMQLLEYADTHLEDMAGAASKYGMLDPPAQFSASVELFRLSTESQLQSDIHYMDWLRTGQESDMIRSDSLLQESFDLEMLALAEFNRAKLGYTEYDGPREKFEEPDSNIAAKVDKIWSNMREKCTGMDDSPRDMEQCMEEADAWRAGHMP